VDSEHSLVGHEEQRAQLRGDITIGKLAHAYLLCGKKHLGKFTLAKWFASEILTQGQTEGEKLRAQKLMKKNVHPDLLILDQLWIADMCTDWDVIARSSNISQEERAKKKVRTNTIGIDDVRELQRRLHETSQTGKTVCLIRSLERLNIEAANALLKILEEPPPHVLFCCTTESPSSLPPTILSRMRIMECAPLPAEKLRPLLSSFDEEERSLLLTIAQGAPGLIFRALENPEFVRALKQLHIRAHRFLEGHSGVERLGELLHTLGEGEERDFVHHLLLHVEESLRSPYRSVVARALALAHQLFSFLSILQSNPQRPLLAAHLTLQSLSL